MNSKCDSKIREVLILPAQTTNDHLEARLAYRILTLYERKRIKPSLRTRFNPPTQLGRRCLHGAPRTRAFRSTQSALRAMWPPMGTVFAGWQSDGGLYPHDRLRAGQHALGQAFPPSAPQLQAWLTLTRLLIKCAKFQTSGLAMRWVARRWAQSALALGI